LACPPLLRLARPCCGCLVVGSLVTWPWAGGASRHRKLKPQRDHSGRSLKHTPAPFRPPRTRRWNLIFSPARARTARRRARASTAHEVVRAVGLQGLVVALGRSTAHWPVAAIQAVTQASEASAKSFIVRSQRSEALLATVDHQRARSEAVAQPSGHQFITRTRRLAAPWSGEGLPQPPGRREKEGQSNPTVAPARFREARRLVSAPADSPESRRGHEVLCGQLLPWGSG
jgi:hypothetical protein